MKVYERVLEFETQGELDLVDITSKIERIVEESGIKDGICLVFVPGATGAVVLNEWDASLMDDLRRTLERIVPRDVGYKHPINARSHLRAMILGNNQCIPIADGELKLGTWQQIIFVECDTRARSRRVIVKVIGN